MQIIETKKQSLVPTVFRLGTKTHKTLRFTALEMGISMNTALIQAVEMWLKEHKGKGAKERGKVRT